VCVCVCVCGLVGLGWSVFGVWSVWLWMCVGRFACMCLCVHLLACTFLGVSVHVAMLHSVYPHPQCLGVCIVSFSISMSVGFSIGIGIRQHMFCLMVMHKFFICVM
jgi:hypothetical protein